MTVRVRVPVEVVRVRVSPAATPSSWASVVPTMASSASSAGQAPSMVHHERSVETPATTSCPVGRASSLLNQVPVTAVF